MSLHKKIKQLTLITSALTLAPLNVFAQPYQSPNYEVNQTFFGTGSENDLNSTNYQGQATVGDLAIGESNSLNYRAYAGFNTTDAPYLEFVVTGDNIDLGYLDTSTTSTGSGTFYVRAWQAHGYSVTTESDPPTYNPGGHQITPLATPTSPTPGNEEFGINMVDNASPDVGANPEQVPDNTFSFGAASAGYDTPDLFKYVKGDVVAESDRSTSVTIYTVSYIFNVGEFTEAGEYSFNHVLVATATY